MNKIRRLIALLTDYFREPDFSNRGQLYLAAIAAIGRDASPNDVAPDELGCAETVNAIHENAFGYQIGGDVSTYRMYRALKRHPRFYEVETPLPGDVIISPTGYGNGSMVGHVGIVGKDNIIMSNSSATGTWEENYTIDEWIERYKNQGGLPVKFYRRF